MKARTLTAVVIVACAIEGCSVLFDMNEYDPRPGAGGTSSSGGSSGGGSSGRLDGGTIGDSGTGAPSASTDASDDRTPAPVACVQEQEPNDDEFDANELVLGENCGVLLGEGDEDFFGFSTTKNVTIELSIPTSVRFELFPDGSATPSQTYSGGGGTSSIGPGTHLVRLSRIVGPTVPPAYKLVRMN
jgi:hypothetical protein